MRRILLIIAALCAALLPFACTPADIVVKREVDMTLKIEKVGGSKVEFSVRTSNEDAWYTYCLISESDPSFSLSDEEAARGYIRYLEEIRETGGKEMADFPREPEGRFEDFAFYRGSRKLKVPFLADDTDYRLVLFQVNPRTHELIGKGHSETFHTPDVVLKPMSFDFGTDKNVLIITPSDLDRTYIWGILRYDQMFDDYAGPFFYLYTLIDMYEDYGFAEPMLSRGVVSIPIDEGSLREGETYCIAAIGYEGGEINSEESFWYFIPDDGTIHGI